MLKRFLRGFLLMLLVAAGFVALLASEWLPPTRPEHQVALDLLRQPQPQPTGRNVFAVLWFLGHDIGDRDPDELLRQDVAAFNALAPTYEGFRSVAADYPEQGKMMESVCPGFPEPCLPALRQLPDAGAALRESYGEQLRASDRVLSADHYSHPFPHEGPLQFPPGRLPIGLRRFANAQEFVSGDGAGGVSATCADLAAWRRLRPTTDLLIHDMVAIAFVQSQAGLLAEMLAEWPAELPLPAACDLALAPVAETGHDQCNVWRGEARFTAASIERGRDEGGSEAEYGLPVWMSEILVNRRNAMEYQAYEQALGCDAFRGVPRPEPGWMDRVFDWRGTELRETEERADFSAYRGQHLEYFDTLRALQIAVWLRSQPDHEAGWANLPDDLSPAPARLSYDGRAKGLVLELQPRSGQATRRWVIPLPPALPTRAPPG